MNLNCVIIEDERASQELLRIKLNEHYPSINILKIIDNVPEALSFLRDHAVDLVFLDNQLKGGFGTQILAELNGFSFEVIFITAYEQHAIDAFRFGATHYLLKPLITDELKEAVDRVFKKNNLETSKHERKISINSHKESVSLPHSQITYLKSNGAYTEVNTLNERKYFVSKNIGKMESQLDSDEFIRVSHSYLVNRTHIVSIKKGRNTFILLSNDEQIPVSQRKFSHVISEIERE